MKRGVALFLLNVMALVAVQPAIAMHFCEGKLYSWGLFVCNDDTSCCQTKAAKHSCCSTYPSENHGSGLNKAQGECCDFETIRVATDDYQKQIEEFNPDRSSLSFENIWIALHNSLKGTVSEPETTLLQNDFPPGGLFLQDVSILHYICIYRI